MTRRIEIPEVVEAFLWILARADGIEPEALLYRLVQQELTRRGKSFDDAVQERLRKFPGMGEEDGPSLPRG